MIPDITVPIRDALVGESAVTSLLPAYLGSFPVFTRRPVPDNTPYPMIVVSPDVPLGDADGMSDFRPLLERDVAIYGVNDSAAKYNVVESVSRAVRALFHRARTSIVVPDWQVVSVAAGAARPAPTDDEQTVGRVVTLTIQLARSY